MFEENQMNDLLGITANRTSILKPSEWYEQNMIMPRGSAFPGKFSFDLTPYWREPLDCVSPNHPAKEITIMKGAQLGGTVAVLNPVVGYTISQNPGNIMFLTGHSDLSEASIIKIDHMIDNCGIRKLIKPNILRKKNSRSGDTNKSKEFAGGCDLKSGSVTNHNLLRQHDVMIMIVDDYDASAMNSKYAGSTRELVQKRTSAFALKKKIYWVSSPQRKGSSNIEEVFKLGDMRYYNVPCPCCGSFIILKWVVDISGSKDKGGIYYEVKNGTVVNKSVGYLCQDCGGFFDDSHKYDMNINGYWNPTVDSKEEYHYSYQISSLYAPAGMDNWSYYAQQYINANPAEGVSHEKKNQTFMNVVLGLTYEKQSKELNANQLQKNTREYEVGELPEKMSLEDGNGQIILLTCACDLNGKIDDARLDYEVVAWTESGSSYSILHGSIGTFIPREGTRKKKVDRERWTYTHGTPKNVWDKLNEVIDQVYVTDTGRRMAIFIIGVDTGYTYGNSAYEYVENSNYNVVALKGKDVDKYRRFDVDTPSFKLARERSDLYLVEGNQIKDDLAELMELKWNKDNEQPSGFMNYPIPSKGLYMYNNYFSHFESEHRIVDEDKNIFRWVKKNSAVQNHLWDCRVYNVALKDIITSLVCKSLKLKNFTWKDYVDITLGRI